MMLRTHLAIIVLVILLFLSSVSNKFVFVSVALIATFLPDIDNAFSTIGRFRGARIIQFFVKHRGIFHSLTFCIVVSVLFAFFIPVLALPFFLGYSLHLFADSFSIEGIKPFWPLKASLSWKIKTGGLRETTLFVILVIADLLIFVLMILKWF